MCQTALSALVVIDFVRNICKNRKQMKGGHYALWMWKKSNRRVSRLAFVNRGRVSRQAQPMEYGSKEQRRLRIVFLKSGQAPAFFITQQLDRW